METRQEVRPKEAEAADQKEARLTETRSLNQPEALSTYGSAKSRAIRRKNSIWVN